MGAATFDILLTRCFVVPWCLGVLLVLSSNRRLRIEGVFKCLYNSSRSPNAPIFVIA